MKISLNQKLKKIENDWHEWRSSNLPPNTIHNEWIVETFDDHAIVNTSGEFWKVPYSIESDKTTFSNSSEWEQVKEAREWVAKSAHAIMRLSGSNHVKAIASTDDEYIIGNYIVLFDGTDLEGERFTKSTELESAYTSTGVLHLDWEHGNAPNGEPQRDDILGHVDWKSATVDERGVFVTRVLKRHDDYVDWIYELVQNGVIGSSSEPVQSGVIKSADGTITHWPLKRDSLTVTPMEPRMKSENAIRALKHLSQKYPNLKSYIQTADDPQVAAATTITSALNDDDNQNKKGNNTMPDFITEDAWNGVQTAVTAMSEWVSTQKNTPTNGLPFASGETTGQKSILNNVYVNHLTTPETVKSAVLADMAKSASGGTTSNIHEFSQQQMKAFHSYMLQGGVPNLVDAKELRTLSRQVFPFEQTKSLLDAGASVAEIKSLQQSAQGSLGGYAVPMQMQSAIIAEVGKLTGIRRRARVISLDTDEIGFVKLDKRPKAVWGNECFTPGRTGLTLEMQRVRAELLGAAVCVTRSLIEDAPMVGTLLVSQFAEAIAEAEEAAFLSGDGIGKPLGVIPGGVNARGLTEVLTGAVDALTTEGIKRLLFAIRSAYKANAITYANRHTASDISLLTTPGGDYAFAVADGMQDGCCKDALGVIEGECMPSVAANTIPIIHADWSGYYIVERFGMTMERFHDSGTGIGTYEYQLRRRVGGDVVEPWKFALQKVGANA